MANPTDPGKILTSPTHSRIRRSSAKQGLVDQYWIELVPYPTGSVRSLWLHVKDGSWKHLDNPDDSTELLIQRVFDHPSRSNHEVIVWYEDALVVGLVVRSKEAS